MTAKSQETKAEAFRRLANARVSNTLKSIKVLGYLGNRKRYKYQAKQIDKIFSALQTELENARDRFRTSSDNKVESGFSL